MPGHPQPHASPPLSWRTRLGVIAMLGAFAALVVTRSAPLGLWYDEVWSLENYQLAPLTHTATDYATPNNHVLFNLLGSLWLRLLGADLDAICTHPVLLRAPTLFAVLAAAWLTFRAARRAGGTAAGLWSLATLLTAVPAAHFASQARGYGLAMLAFAAMLDFGLRESTAPSRRGAVGLVLATATLLYTSPGNLYAALAIGSALPLAARASGQPWARCLRGGAMVVLGILTAALLLSPMLRQIASSPFVRADAPFRWATLSETMPRVLVAFGSGRWLLLVTAAGGLLALRGRVRQPVLALAAIALLVPFALSFVRGDRPFDRVFVPLLPAFSVLVGVGVATAATAIRRWPGALAAIAAIAISLPTTLVWQLRRHDAQQLEDLQRGIKPQDLCAAYYLGPFDPGAVARRARALASGGGVFFGEVDLPAMRLYLEREGLTPRPAAALRDALATHGSVLVISTNPDQTARQLTERIADSRCHRVEGPVDFHSILRLSVPERAPRTGNLPDPVDQAAAPPAHR